MCSTAKAFKNICSFSNSNIVDKQKPFHPEAKTTGTSYEYSFQISINLQPYKKDGDHVLLLAKKEKSQQSSSFW